ncbi:MAG: GNAT family N-acetyltransferase [Flavobacteriales bacterium]|nr:GNAT family N-acetyltransferase [Flavobacteriales bacterium]
MLVQTHFPKKLAPHRYDSYLASGWFRGSVMLYKVDLLCVDSGVFGVVNIRLNLDQHELKKSQRKRMARADRKFTTTVKPCVLDAIGDAQEALYDQQKHRFQGFVHGTLREYLASGFPHTVFDTYELCVYDGERLAAVSYFDFGDRSMASLIGLQDPAYQTHGLGIYTMLCEIEFGKQRGMRWYYPGYVFDEPSPFDYKLDLGQMEYYTPTKRWGSHKKFDPTLTRAHRLRLEMNALSSALKAEDLPHDILLYPFFSLGFMAHWSLEFVTLPMFVELVNRKGKRQIVGFEPLRQVFIVMDVQEASPESIMIDMDYRTQTGDSSASCTEILRCKMPLIQSTSVEGVIDFLNMFKAQ